MFLMSSRTGAVTLISMISAVAITLGVYYRFDRVVTDGARSHLIPQLMNVKTLTGTNKPRVMCMIFTTPGNFMKRGRAVRLTWSRHCYRRRFFYSRQGDNTNNPMANFSEAVALDVPDGREHLTTKTMAALAYSYKNFGNDTDWFMKCDDDLYVVFSNLLLHLCRYDPSTPAYIGFTIHGTFGYLPKGYNSGGAGYLLNAEATKKVMNEGITKFPQNCKTNSVGGWEDVDMGDCMKALNIFPAEVKNSLMQLSFHPDNPLRLLRGILQESDDHGLEPYYSMKYNGDDFGDYNNTQKSRMLGPNAITFHYIRPSEMIFIDYLISMHKTETSTSKFCP